MLHIASNDADEPSFDIALSGRAPCPAPDDDNDGVSNSDELALAGCGLDPLVDSSGPIQQLRDRGFFRTSDMQALALGRPLLQRSPTTGHFHLQIAVTKSSNLQTWSSLTGFAPTSYPDTGLINLDITPTGASHQFYQVVGGVPWTIWQNARHPGAAGRRPSFNLTRTPT